MPAKREADGLQKHTFHLFEGDYERIRDMYPELGAAAVIRRIVRKFILSIDEKSKTTDFSEKQKEIEVEL